MTQQSSCLSLSRRGVIFAALSAAGGMVLHMQPAAASGTEIDAWLIIEPDDSVTIRVPKSEMGQGIFTSLPMLVAEELRCDWNKVRPEYASAHRNLASQVYGSLGTGGSRSVRSLHATLQEIGANARARLISAAARQWGVPASECEASDGVVHHTASGRALSYGVLAPVAAKIQLNDAPSITSPDKHILVGKPLARLDTKAKCTGQAQFGIDVRLPGMLYAAVSLCPVPGGKVKSYDTSNIIGRRGIQAVMPIPGGLAVVADRFWRARQAAVDLPVEWDFGPGAGTSSAQFHAEYRAALDGSLVSARDDGDVTQALKQGMLVQADYDVPHLSHAPMEPLNCTAHVRPEGVEVWLGTQNPDMALRLAAHTAGVSPDRVQVHNQFLGGGFGRRSMNDELIQAVTVATVIGKPVKLVWTREVDIRHDRYRPQAALRCRASLAADGSVSALHIQTAVGSIMRSLGWGTVPSGIEPQAVEGLANNPYSVGSQRVECVLKNTHIPVMFWRSVGSSQNAFVMESFIDELAHAAKQDPYQFRRRLLADRPDFLRVLDTAAEKANWGSPLPAGKGRGIAIHECYDTIVAQVAEVAVSAHGEVKVERVVVAVDCGHVVNPKLVQMQMESGVIYGLTAALYDAITIKDGAVEQGNFDTYQMVRMADAPAIETYLSLSNGARWGGIGEPGTPPVAPAVCNAIFAITGKRIRSLPISANDLTSRT
jgi:isoquinoline 1-oxidoreductase subunit beta